MTDFVELMLENSKKKGKTVANKAGNIDEDQLANIMAEIKKGKKPEF
jgi:hypothetical protein